MNESKMREEFEVWWVSNVDIEVFDLHRCEFPMQKPEFVQPYACHDTQRAWLSWQASREVMVVVLPEWDESCAFHYSVDVMRLDEVIKAIEAAGVKVKS